MDGWKADKPGEKRHAAGTGTGTVNTEKKMPDSAGAVGPGVPGSQSNLVIQVPFRMEREGDGVVYRIVGPQGVVGLYPFQDAMALLGALNKSYFEGVSHGIESVLREMNRHRTAREARMDQAETGAGLGAKGA